MCNVRAPYYIAAISIKSVPILLHGCFSAQRMVFRLEFIIYTLRSTWSLYMVIDKTTRDN